METILWQQQRQFGRKISLKFRYGITLPGMLLVEIENIHDTALIFEPIHRLLFNVKPRLLNAMTEFFGGNLN